MAKQIRIALGQMREVTHENLTFARQLGLDSVQFNTPDLPTGSGAWELSDLLWLKERCERYGLSIEALENVPVQFYDRAMLGLPGRDEQIENYQRTIRNMGKAGIPILGYHWMPNGVWRTSSTTAGRGGALVTAFDMDHADGPLTAGQREPGPEEARGRTFSADDMWAHYEYFMKAVIPIAEEAGVKLALHPDDPPVSELGGIARIFNQFDGFKRAMEMVASPNSGLDFCMGCFSEMGPDVIGAIRHFGSQGKIFYVHFRDVQGCVPRFQECFLGEGNVDIVEAIRTLKEVGFTGFLLDDHVPHMTNDSSWGHRARAHAIGYISGMLEAVNRLT
jgi:mannonate dehydratase